MFVEFARGRPPLVPLWRPRAETATYFVETLVDIHGRHDEEVLMWCWEGGKGGCDEIDSMMLLMPFAVI
jgi:hypothetical protein